MRGTVNLTAGQAVRVEADFAKTGAAPASLTLGWQDTTPLLDQAVTAARSADVAVVFAGYGESEGTDLDSVSLDPATDALIEAVARANPRTIVVLNTGSAVTMPWLRSVPAVFEAWYPGQEDGNAIAALLFGDVNPSGKLPVTFPGRLADVPARTPQQWPGAGGRVDYSEGLLVGYRWYDAEHIQPEFPFGFGLSYTSFRLSHLTVTPPGRRGTVTVRLSVTNTGRAAGAETVQVYVGDPAAAGEPPKQLKGFRKVLLRPGQTRQVSIPLDRNAFAYWNSPSRSWAVAPGSYQVMVGNSSASLPLRAAIQVHRLNRPSPPLDGQAAAHDRDHERVRHQDGEDDRGRAVRADVTRGGERQVQAAERGHAERERALLGGGEHAAAGTGLPRRHLGEHEPEDRAHDQALADAEHEHARRQRERARDAARSRPAPR